MVRFSQCPLCEHRSLRTLTTPQKWIGLEVFAPYKVELGLSQCRSCRYIFCNPQLEQNILDLFYQGNTYTCHQYNNPGRIDRHKVSFVLSILEKHSGPLKNRKLLDFGCGGGNFLKSAQEAGWQVTGFDIGQRSMRSCHELSLNATDRFEDLVGGNFDFISLNHVFEHVADFHGLLESLKKILSSSGKLFIEVPNALSLRAKLSAPVLVRRFNFDERYRGYPIHLSYFSKPSLEKLFKVHGFNIEVLTTCGLGLEELIDARPSDNQHQSDSKESHSRPLNSNSTPGWLKQMFKERYFGAGWGENIIAVISPRA